MKYVVTAFPYVVEEGYIDIPDGVKDLRDYVIDHWTEIDFVVTDSDYAGTEFEIDEAW